jgi:hypothetical protein
MVLRRWNLAPRYWRVILSAMRYRPHFTIRELLLLTAIVGLTAAMLTDHLTFRASVERIRLDIARTVNSARDNAIILDNNGYVISGDRIYSVDSSGELVAQ